MNNFFHPKYLFNPGDWRKAGSKKIELVYALSGLTETETKIVEENDKELNRLRRDFFVM
jgi:hypothetical protein